MKADTNGKLKNVDDKTLHKACLRAIKGCNIALEEEKKAGVVLKKRSNGPAL